MNSLGSSSKWPSYDSLPSTSSFLLSESEQTEDEAEVFSEGEGDDRIRKPLTAEEGITRSGNYLAFPPLQDQLHLRSKHDQSQHCSDKTKYPDSASSPGVPTLRSSSATPGDLAFAQKCADLQRFIHPLLELLHGLKTGRFDRGLTSFQQSVAIDRLQRILGILQKPEMGEKYLRNLLQIEILLKMWFPQFKSTDTLNQNNTPRLTPHWRQNQLHIPVKKRKLSWSDPEQAGNVPTKFNHRQHGKPENCHAATSLDTVSTCLTGSPKKLKTSEEEKTGTAGNEFKDGTGAVSNPLYICSRRENEISLPSSCGSPATQDSSVSSSNTISTTDSP